MLAGLCRRQYRAAIRRNSSQGTIENQMFFPDGVGFKRRRFRVKHRDRLAVILTNNASDFLGDSVVRNGVQQMHFALKHNTVGVRDSNTNHNERSFYRRYRLACYLNPSRICYAARFGIGLDELANSRSDLRISTPDARTSVRHANSLKEPGSKIQGDHKYDGVEAEREQAVHESQASNSSRRNLDVRNLAGHADDEREISEV